MEKVGGYLRVSTTGQIRGISPEAQREAIIKYCQGNDLDLVKIYEDLAISGAKDDRPGLNEMLSDAKEKKFEKLIFYKLDRFGRSINQILENYKKLESMEIGLVSIHEKIDTSTPLGRLFRNLLAAFAEFEREIIIERTQGGRMGSLKEKGKFIYERMFGYEWNKEKKIFEIIPEEAEIVKKIFHLYTGSNLSFNSVSEKLQKEGLRKIPNSQIGKILKRQSYMTGIINANITMKENGKRVPSPRESWIKFPCPKIISPQIFRKAQDNLKRNIGFPRKYDRENDQFVLRGLMKCHCGRSIMAATVNKRRYYVCISRWTGKPSAKNLTIKNHGKRCDLPYIPAEKIENQFFKGLIFYLTNPRRALKRIEEKLGGTSLDPQKIKNQIRSLEIRIGQEEGKINRWLDLYGEGKMKKDVLYSKNEESQKLIDGWKLEKENLQNNLDNFEKNQTRLKEVRESFRGLKKLSSQIREFVAKMDTQTKKEFYNSIFESRSLEIHDVRRMMIEEGLEFTGKENEFELRGIEGLNLEKVSQFLIEKPSYNDDDSSIIQFIRMGAPLHASRKILDKPPSVSEILRRRPCFGSDGKRASAIGTGNTGPCGHLRKSGTCHPQGPGSHGGNFPLREKRAESRSQAQYVFPPSSGGREQHPSGSRGRGRPRLP